MPTTSRRAAPGLGSGISLTRWEPRTVYRGVRVASSAALLPSVEAGELEFGDPQRIGKDVDLGDPSVHDDEAHDCERAAARNDDGSGGSIDQGGPYVGPPGGGEERFGDAALTSQVRIRNRRLPVHATPGAAGQLPGCCGGALSDRSDLVEGHREHVVQHIRDPLGRRKGLERDEQCQPDRIGGQGLKLGVGPVERADDRVGYPRLQRLFAPRLTRATAA